MVPQCCTGNSGDLPSGSSLGMLHFPYDTDAVFDTPEKVYNPDLSDVALRTHVLGLALLLEGVHLVHGHGSAATTHTDDDMEFLKEACRKVALRFKPFI